MCLLLKERTKSLELQIPQLAPWNEFLMSLILHVINTSLAVLKYTLKRNELIQINSDPCSVFETETAPITLSLCLSLFLYLTHTPTFIFLSLQGLS